MDAHNSSIKRVIFNKRNTSFMPYKKQEKKFSYSKLQRYYAKKMNLPIEITNSIGIEFILIPPGTFKMGGQWESKLPLGGRAPPQFIMTLTKGYYLSKYVVTQAQWKRINSDNPSFYQGDDLPITNITWHDCQIYIEKLNSLEKIDKYRLPTSAEWENACRGGTKTIFFHGNDEKGLRKYAWIAPKGSSSTKIMVRPVGQKLPNPFGLYDMLGNVLEWVHDWSTGTESPGMSYYGLNRLEASFTTKQIDYHGPTEGQYRIRRGGSYRLDSDRCVCGYQGLSNYPDSAESDTGFRILKDL